MTEIDTSSIPPGPSGIEFTEPKKSVERDDTVAPMPIWASILVILLSLSAGGWIVKWYVGTDMLQRETIVLDENPPAIAVRNNGGFVPPVVATAETTTFHCPEATLVVSHRPKKPARIESLVYNAYGFVPTATATTLKDARTILNPKLPWRTDLKVTDAQATALRAQAGWVRMIVSRNELDQLLKLYSDYDAAKDKAAPLVKLQAGITDIAKKAVDPTRNFANERAAKIHAALTDDQWHKFTLMGGH